MAHRLEVEGLAGVEGVLLGADHLRGPVPVRDEADGEGVDIGLGDGDHGVGVGHAGHAGGAQPVFNTRRQERVLDHHHHQHHHHYHHHH